MIRGYREWEEEREGGEGKEMHHFLSHQTVRGNGNKVRLIHSSIRGKEEPIEARYIV